MKKINNSTEPINQSSTYQHQKNIFCNMIRLANLPKPPLLWLRGQKGLFVGKHQHVKHRIC